MKDKLTITVAITSCYSGESIIKTIKSLRDCTGGREVIIRLVTDTIPLSQSMKRRLNSLGVVWSENIERGSQNKKYLQIINRTDTDIIVLTQDDVSFSINTLSEIEKLFRNNSDISMIATNVIPIQPKTLIEKVIFTGVEYTKNITKKWNNGDNYLLANGRCLAFRVKFLSKFRIPLTIVNGDGYFYFENKRNGGKCKYAHHAKVYYQIPSNIKEHLNQSSRFQYSKIELQQYFKEMLKNEYKIPFNVLFLEYIRIFLKYPFYTFGYLLLMGYSRIKKRKQTSSLNPLWDIDLSTKSSNRTL